jgi:hypothetical protein
MTRGLEVDHEGMLHLHPLVHEELLGERAHRSRLPRGGLLDPDGREDLHPEAREEVLPVPVRLT